MESVEQKGDACLINCWPGVAAGVLGLLGVALGAFGAHVLEDFLAREGRQGVWDTAVFYQWVHALALAVVWLVGRQCGGAGRRRFYRAAGFWLFGVVVFSGSLYGLACGGPGWLGPITPIGGTALLVGWGLFIHAVVRSR